MTRRVAVIGAGGYAGATLLALLLRHPGCVVAGVFGSGRGVDEQGAPPTVGQLIPSLRGVCDLEVGAASVDAVLGVEPEVVFLATPHEASAALVGPLRSAGRIVLDLSAAFRLSKASAYPEHYGFEHPAPDLLEGAVYGLVEHSRDALAGADLIAVPGCYPTASILAIKPLVDAGALDSDRRVIVDAVSGVSGAGRSPSSRTHFCEVSLQPYGVLSHRHAPEIEEHSGAGVIFTPQIAPFERGIVATIHADLARGWDAERVGEVYGEAYGEEPFVRLLPSGTWPSTRGVDRTNFCDLGWAVHADSGHLLVVSAIDNLMKGAAGQAVHALNVRTDAPETLGLGGVAA